MLPEWMIQTDEYVPPKDGGTFIMKSIQTLARVMSRIRTQRGHEKELCTPAIVKLIALIVSLLVISASHNMLILMLYTAVLLVYLCTWPANDIWNILKSSLAAVVVCSLIMLPAVIMNPGIIGNSLRIIYKSFICVTLLAIFNHTTQWNHITAALKGLHIPGIFIFTIDITLKYIVLLGQHIDQMLTSVQLRSVGKNQNKYSSVGGIMGTSFIQGIEMNEQMYEAMICRGFTDDYKGL